MLPQDLRPGWRTDLEPPQKRLAAIEMPEGKRLAQRFRAAATVYLYLRRGDEMRRFSEGNHIDCARVALARTA